MECPLGSIRLADSRMGLCIEFKQFGLVFGSLFFPILFLDCEWDKKELYALFAYEPFFEFMSLFTHAHTATNRHTRERKTRSKIHKQ